MSVSTMEKLTAVALKRDTDALVRRLMKLRAVSINEPGAAELAEEGLSRPDVAVREATERVAKIDRALPALTRRSTRKKNPFAGAAAVSFDEFRSSGREEKAWRAVNRTVELLDRAEKIKTEDAALAAECAALTPYLDLTYPPDFAGTATTVHILGSLPPGAGKERLTEATARLAFTFDVLCEDSTGIYISALAHKQDEPRVMTALSGLGFLRATFPRGGELPKHLFDRADGERRMLAAEATSGEAQLKHLAGNLTDVEILSDMERTTLLAEENKKKLSETGECTVFSMWCPVPSKEKVTAALDKVGAAYEFEPPAPGDDVPILLRNNAYARNFEWVLGMYSYPKYGKYDPTFIMSLFYFVIFGLMFADAGYGLLLSAACFGIVYRCHPRESMKRFLLMFGYCGISCMICGVLFGAYFGNFPLAFMENVLKIPASELPRLSLLPSDAANIAILFDPLQNPMAFLVLSLAVGAVHLIAGMAVRAVLLCKEGKPLDALFDIGSYWLLFAGLGVIFVQKKAGLIVLLCGVAAVVATQGRSKKGAMKFFGGLLGLYNLIDYASDLLSYSRILALGLAAGVIGQVVNILATLKGASFVGILMMILVFCLGHVLNLAINVLGTFVHTSRLQYIEFFGKFYEDGGTPFKPVTPSDRFADDVSGDGEETAPAKELQEN